MIGNSVIKELIKSHASSEMKLQGKFNNIQRFLPKFDSIKLFYVNAKLKFRQNNLSI